MYLSLIAAIDRNRAIGYENKLLFWLPNDLKRFKTLTIGHTILMGRKTFESLPKGALPQRRNVVLSTDKSLQLPGAEVFPTLEDALASCCPDEHVYIIGGASLYHHALSDRNRRRSPPCRCLVSSHRPGTVARKKQRCPSCRRKASLPLRFCRLRAP